MSGSLAWKVRGLLSPALRSRVRRAADRLLAPVGSVNGATTTGRSFAITFDDGPDPEVTPAMLDLLAERGVRATFFVLTYRTRAQPDLVRRIVAEGHQLALHGDRHTRFTTVPSAQVQARLAAARDHLEDVAQQPVRLFRPPFGAQSVRTYLSARRCGLTPVVWGPYAQDWVESLPVEVADRGMVGLDPGSVLLLHDGLEVPAGDPVPTFDRVEAVRLLLDRVAAADLRPTTVDGLLADGTARRTAWFRP